MFHFRRYAVAVAGGCLLALMWVAPAHAVSENRSNFIGGFTYPVTVSGAQANIQSYNPRVCSPGGTSAWSMITVANLVGGSELAQIGWIRGSGFGLGDATYYFYEWTTLTDNNPPILIAPDTDGYGTSHKYTVYTNGSGSTLFLIDNTGYAHATLGWTPNSAQFLGVNRPGNCGDSIAWKGWRNASKPGSPEEVSA
jgi:hypothetical protein